MVQKPLTLRFFLFAFSTMSFFKRYIQVPQDEAEFQTLVEKAKDFSLMHGSCMRSKDKFDPDVLQFAPFVLIPSPFPRKEFETAVALQPILNELTHRVAHDHEFLKRTLSNTIKVDSFTAKLFQIYETVRTEGIRQPIALGCIRSDLMLESSCDYQTKCRSSTAKVQGEGQCLYCCFKQVEINTIAAGFGHLGPISRAVQEYVLRELGEEQKLVNLPENKALSGLCGGMIKAWELFGSTDAAILFVIEDIPYNICDQRFHEFYIREARPEIRVMRQTLTQIHKKGRLTDSGDLQIDGQTISVVYFRAGYEPAQYPSENEWDARLMIERSTAIKCPTIYYHLAGTKKVQQELAMPGVLQRFLKDESNIAAVKEIFTGIFSLDKSPEGDEMVKLALTYPERYVLKPQREGGGNNVFGTDIPPVLSQMSDIERSAWVLMEQIVPPKIKSYIIRPRQPIPTDTSELVSELGIFGVIIGTKDEIFVNEQVGHMLRTKLSTANEGGVAAGLGALDSPYLIDEAVCECKV